MSAIRAQSYAEDRASGAVVSDGSVYFNADKNQYLTRTFSSAGNRRTFTWSGWVKRDQIALQTSNKAGLFGCDGGSDATSCMFTFDNSTDDTLRCENDFSSGDMAGKTVAVYRDVTGWYHVCIAVDSTQSSVTDGLRFYVNGKLEELQSTTWSQNTEFEINAAIAHCIASDTGDDNRSFGGNMSQVHFIDGQSLDASYFGYTDPLTNTWRPKKFTGDYKTAKTSVESALPYSAASRFTSYAEEGTVNNDATGYTLPMSNPAHYGGKARDLASGGWITTTANAATEDFFMGMWVKFDTYETAKQWGVDLAGGYIYMETRSSGVLRIRHDGGSSSDSSATDVGDGNWHHIGLSRSGSTLYGLLDGTAVVSTTSGVSGDSIGANEKFYFWGGHSSYRIDGQVIDPFVYIGQGASSYTTPTAPLVDSSGTINYLSGFSSTQAYYISPGVTITGSSPNEANWTNSFHLPLDGNSPIGVDQSGLGNDWTPMDLPSSSTLDKATGALPILNTSSGGNVAVPGVRGQAGIAVTVYNPTGSQNRFYFDGVEAPSYNFARGQTITFDTSDSTVATHPFRLSGVSDGAHAADYYSVDFDGTGDYLSIAESTDWLFEEGDFTVEFWAYIDNIATDGGIVTNMDNFNSSSQYNSRWVIGLYNSELRIWTADDGDHVLHDYFPPQQEWVHYAFTRETGNKFTLYRNGTNIFTATKTSDFDTNGPLLIGYLNGLGTYDGKIADLRLVKGTAVYTTNFQPPVTSLTNITNTKVLCCNSSTVTGSTVTPTTITANGDPTSSNDNPYDTYPFSTVTGISEGTVGAATTITFPYNSPDTLYYHCSSHSGMGGSIGLTTDIQTADPYASKNVLAVAFDGGSNDYSNLINTGSTKKSITENTSSAETMEYRNFYLSSYKFDGTNDVVYAADSTEFTMGGGDWTIECWIRRRRVDTDEWFLTQSDATSANTSFGLHIDASTNYLEGRARSDSSGAVDFAGTTPMQTGLWYHCALVRDGSTLRLFLNGTQENTNAIAGTLIDSSAPLCMGALTDAGSAATSCYMQDVRVYKGIAKYTKSFIPASTWNSISPDSPSGTSYGSELTAPTKGSVSFDNDSDSLNVADNADFDLGTNDFTIECFALLYTIGQFNNIFAVGTDSSDGYRVDISTGNKLRLLAYIGGSWSTIITGGTDLYQKKWFHLAVTRSGSSFDLWVDGVRDATTVTNSDSITNPSTKLEIGRLTTNSLDRNYHGLISNLRFVNGTALYTQNFTPSNKPLTTTSQGATSSEVKLLCCQSQNSATAAAASPDGAVVGYSGYLSGGLVPGSANQYVPSNCFDGDITTTHVRHKTTPGKEGRVGWYFNPPGGIAYSSLEIHTGVSGVGTQEYILNGGSATGFAENTWVEIDSSSGTLTSLQITEGSTGNSNIYLGAIRINGSTILTDTIYNGGTGAVISDSQPSEFNPFDTNIDMVMGKSGIYATLNPLYKNSNVSLTDGNLSMSISSAGHYSSIATLGMTTGKYYWEVDSGTGWTNDPAWGIVGEEAEHYDDQTNSVPGAWVRNNGRRYYEGTEGDVWMEVNAMNADEGSTLGLAYDGIAGTLQVWIDGRYQGVAFTGLKDGMTRNLGSGTSNRWYPCLKMYDGGPVHINFGQQPFKYPCPYGFGPLCTGNLERPGVARPTNYVGLSSYVGNGSDNSVSDLEFKPDLIWIKDTDDGDNWITVNSVTGIGNMTKLNEPEKEYSETGDFTSFDDKGYSFGLYNNINQSGITYTGYAWKAGGNKNTFNIDDVGYATAAAAGLDGGTIDPIAASVGTQQGLSIIKYTGTGSAGTIAHGLSQKPSFMTFRNLPNPAGSLNWPVYHQSKGATGYIRLDQDNAWGAKTSVFNDTEPTSSVLTIGTDSDINISGEDYMGWIWHDVEGLQRFGIYTGNGLTNGAFVELGFRPALVVCKRTDSTGNWNVFDNVRGTTNLNYYYYYLNLQTASQNDGTNGMDFLANGFKCRGNLDHINTNDEPYIYMAWAESPFRNIYGATGPGR